MDPRRAFSRSRLARWALLATLALACIVAPTVGLVHGIVHHRALAADHVAHAAQPGATAPEAAPKGLLAALFGGHEDEGSCLLFDRVTHADAVSAAPLSLPLLLSPGCLALAEGEFFARWSALFDARGPPASR